MVVAAVNGRLVVLPQVPVCENGEHKSGRLFSCILPFKMEQERLQDIEKYLRRGEYPAEKLIASRV